MKYLTPIKFNLRRTHESSLRGGRVKSFLEQRQVILPYILMKDLFYRWF